MISRFRDFNNLIMISIKRSEVPLYLHKGSFYESLLECDDEIFSVPCQYFKDTSTVNCNGDLLHLLSTLRYWCVSECPKSLINYCLQDSQMIYIEDLQTFLKDLKYLAILMSLRSVSSNARVRLAICSGDINIVSYFIQSHRALMPQNVCVFAAEAGHTDVLSLLLEEGWEEYEAAAMAAAGNGHSECLLLILRRGVRNKHICIAAVQHGHLQCLKYAHQHGCALSPEVLNISVLNGQLDCFNYAHENGCIVNPTHLSMSVVYNQFPLFTHICELIGVLGAKVTTLCAEYGRLDMLAHAYAYSSSWDAHTCAIAAAKGHIECLQYLHERSCPWDGETTYLACMHGHLDCLCYAHQQGCELNPQCYMVACQHQHVACMQYLTEIARQ